ncbi:MAG TPA: alkaline phosphatase family protein [Sphingomicrobium sp.]|nr:alkaline phosphatase family protein [Sphingomicrobium sp.]
MPRYEHIFVIVAENQSYGNLMHHASWAPNIQRLAEEYGTASRFYGEVHPSSGNYLAIVAGDTFGIVDDDAFFCRAGNKNADCPFADQPAYVDHEISAPSLADQLTAKGLTWKAYLEDLPTEDPLAAFWPTSDHPSGGRLNNLYGSKHNAFVHFRKINRQPLGELSRHFVGFDQLAADLASDTMPSYAHIIPNQCNDMHGLSGPNVPADCKSGEGLLRRGDAEIGMLVEQITQSKMWREAGNAAIVITFDESDNSIFNLGPQYCCGSDPDSEANFGGGHILTIVITNHGPRHLVDPTPYNHYSLLRTTEIAFGISEHLGHAADTDKGVVAMTPLFALRRNSTNHAIH